MSYEYAKIPLNLGLNIICGPNGAGKSSILLAISVAMGQAYTERGRKFSDLIRWGEDVARVTLTFDNKLKGGVRPISNFDTDYFRLSRFLKKDGNYWFQANFNTITKDEVTKILRKYGINPDNMLIIMHQHMMMEFGVTTPQQKLMMVEEAVGFKEYREKLYETQNRLNQVLSEEESVSNLLKNTEQTLEYWKDEYERYLRKKELFLKKKFLEREFAWANLIKQERIGDALRDNIQRKNTELSKKEEEISKTKATVKDFKENLNQLRSKQNKLQYTKLELEKENMVVEETLRILRKTIDNYKDYNKNLKLTMDENNKDDILKTNLIHNKFFEISSLRNVYSKLSERSGSIKLIERNLDELQSKAQLLKHEVTNIENEKTLLEKLVKDKESKEKTLQQDRKKLDNLSIINEQIGSKLEVLNNIRELINREETRRDYIGKELDRLIRRLPSVLKIHSKNDPVELAKEILKKLRSEVDSKETIREQIMKVDTFVQSITDEQQTIIATIQVHKNELEKLANQHSKIHKYLEEKGEKLEIKCDICGSILTPNQWANHLKNIEEKIKAIEKKLSTIQSKLKVIQVKLSDKIKKKEHLYQEEKILEIIYPMLTQSKQLLDDITNSYKELKKYLDEKKRIVTNLTGVLDVDKDHLSFEQKVKDIQTEVRILKFETHRLEKELSNFEDLHITPQRIRVEKAQKASKSLKKMLPKMMEYLKKYMAEIEFQVEFTNQKRIELEEKVSINQVELDKIEERVCLLTDRHQDEKEKEIRLAFQKENITREIDGLNSKLNEAEREVTRLQPLAEKMGARVETERGFIEISADIKVTDAHLALLKEVSEDVENIYTNYLKLCNELKEKIILVTENRERTLREIDERKKIWRKLLQSLLDEVNKIFNTFLEKIGATGRVRLVNTEDIETAGLELIVGFKGAKPQILDSRTQSGGERSSATMAFLLALQHHIKSPFRAVDEFDVHMDPKNRETISQMLLTEIARDKESQYLAITPGQLTSLGEDVKVITVQNIQGKSEIKLVAQAV